MCDLHVSLWKTVMVIFLLQYIMQRCVILLSLSFVVDIDMQHIIHLRGQMYM